MFKCDYFPPHFLSTSFFIYDLVRAVMHVNGFFVCVCVYALDPTYWVCLYSGDIYAALFMFFFLHFFLFQFHLPRTSNSLHFQFVHSCRLSFFFIHFFLSLLSIFSITVSCSSCLSFVRSFVHFSTILS